MKKQLLLTTDDFGMCHSVNLGIVQAMTQGIAASTNFLVPCPWFSEALALAKEHELKVGVHLCLTCDWDRLMWGPITEARTLRTPSGHFPAYHKDLEALGATDADMEAELRAQIETVFKLYGRPSHVETHMMEGRSNHPVQLRIRAIIKRLCKEYGLIFTYERDEAGRLLYFEEEECSSRLDHEEVFKILEGWTKPGKYHLFGHAAVASEELSAICSPGHPSRYWADKVRVRDLEFYTDPKVKRRIEGMGFELTGIEQIA